jgi:hypothetical protein
MAKAHTTATTAPLSSPNVDTSIQNKISATIVSPSTVLQSRAMETPSKRLKKRYKIKYLRYDGIVSQDRRIEIQQEFSQADSPRLMLLTAGAGGAGLNLTSGRIVIVAEEWWNESVEDQAIACCHRPGVGGEVIAVEFCVTNSAINNEIRRVRALETRTNETLMAPLIHKHDKVLEIVELV